MRTPKEPAALISAMEASVGVKDKQRFSQVLEVARKLSGFSVSGHRVVLASRQKVLGTPGEDAKVVGGSAVRLSAKSVGLGKAKVRP